MKKKVPVLNGFKCPRLQFHFRSADPGVYSCQMKTPSNANNMISVVSANVNTIIEIIKMMISDIYCG